MLFHTWVFAAFFLVFYPVYLAVKGTRLRDYWLLLSSYVFYGWWNPLYLLLISYSTVVDYFVVLRMAKSLHQETVAGAGGDPTTCACWPRSSTPGS